MRTGREMKLNLVRGTRLETVESIFRRKEENKKRGLLIIDVTREILKFFKIP